MRVAFEIEETNFPQLGNPRWLPRTPDGASKKGAAPVAPPPSNPKGFWVFTRFEVGVGNRSAAAPPRRQTAPRRRRGVAAAVVRRPRISPGPKTPHRLPSRFPCRLTPAARILQGGGSHGKADLWDLAACRRIHHTRSPPLSPCRPRDQSPGQQHPRTSPAARLTPPLRPGPPPRHSRTQLDPPRMASPPPPTASKRRRGRAGEEDGKAEAAEQA
jgi:hypothetical protein